MREDREASVICESVEPNPKNIVRGEKIPAKKRRTGIFIRAKSKTDARLIKLETLKSIFSGTFPVYCFFEDSGKYEHCGEIELSEPVCAELEYIFGKDNVAVRK